MKKRPTIEQQLDPSFDNTLCAKCGYNDGCGNCLWDDERIPRDINECDNFMENEDIGYSDEDLGINQDEPEY